MNTELTNSITATSTSGVSLSADRPLHADEAALVAALLDMWPEGAPLKSNLATARVQEMKDGGMGSLLFTSDEMGRKARQVSAAQSSDEDGVPLEISLNVDEHGALFELDIWKVDYSPLRRLPAPSDLQAA